MSSMVVHNNLDEGDEDGEKDMMGVNVRHQQRGVRESTRGGCMIDCIFYMVVRRDMTMKIRSTRLACD
jgi:hypothetical protein